MEMKFMGTNENIIWSQAPTSLRRKVPLNVKNFFFAEPIFTQQIFVESLIANSCLLVSVDSIMTNAVKKSVISLFMAIITHDSVCIYLEHGNACR